MSEVFDLLAGTSTGSILASSLSMPAANGSNKFWANDVTDVYLKNGTDVFTEYYVADTTFVWGILLFALIGGGLGYLIGLRMLTNP
jgi:patatin-like phospholipase/acyl hydrolase